MKKIFSLLVITALFVACKTESGHWANTSPEIDIAKSLVKDYQAGNWTSWNNHYADSAKIWHNTIDSITKQQLQDGLKADIANYVQYGFVDKDSYFEMITDDKNQKWVYFWGVWEGTIKGSNQKFVIPVHLAMNFSNNKIVREFGYYNRSAVDAALKEMQVAAPKPLPAK